MYKAEEAMENPLGKKGLLRIAGLEVSDRKEAMSLFSSFLLFDIQRLVLSLILVTLCNEIEVK